MVLETTGSCNEILKFRIHNNISATPFSCHETTFFHRNPPPIETIASNSSPSTAGQPHSSLGKEQNLVVEGGGGWKKKRREKTRVCENKEEAESRRMTHIAVERNRRKQMNHHLAVLRSLLPESYIQRGDQASIVGGAIEFVKELQHLLQSLEARKFLSTQQQVNTIIFNDQNSNFATNPSKDCEMPQMPLYFHEIFTCPQYTWSQVPNNTSKNMATLADIEVNLVQTHANLRILMRKRLSQLSKIIVFLQTCCLSILHLNVTTLDSLVLYSISLKVEEECWLNSADEIADAVHQILRLIEEEAATQSQFTMY